MGAQIIKFRINKFLLTACICIAFQTQSKAQFGEDTMYIKTHDGGCKEAINPIDNSYLNYKEGIIDGRIMPTRGLGRGDYNPGARGLVTLATFANVAKLQLDLGANLEANFYI